MADDETTEKPKCFIAMPITMRADMAGLYPDGKTHFEHVLQALFVPAVERAGYEAVRPIFSGSMSIPEGIVSNLIHADMVLCDMSVLNANVFFELGIRTAMNGPVAIVKDQHIPGAPFDNATIGYHEYDAMLGAWDIESQISQLALHITATAEKGPGNALWKHYGITEVADPPQYPGEDAAREQKLDEIMFMVRRLEERIQSTVSPSGFIAARSKDTSQQSGDDPPRGRLVISRPGGPAMTPDDTKAMSSSLRSLGVVTGIRSAATGRGTSSGSRSQPGRRARTQHCPTGSQRTPATRWRSSSSRSRRLSIERPVTPHRTRRWPALADRPPPVP